MKGLQEEPERVLADILLESGSAIERQEARGQAAFIASGLLPVEYGYGSSPEQLEAMGIVFGDIVEGDPIFQQATLPDGWSIKKTDHSMWTKLVDDQGTERASIFYKAAFYDRRALIHVNKGKTA